MARFQYAFRPGKHIERRMMVDACRRIEALADLANYEYVGFGGFEFVDFELIHRELGLRRLVSIEEDAPGAPRYEFNRPFADITIHFDRASAVLPDLLDDDSQRIVWLDYTSRLNHEVLQDVNTCLRKLQSGSILIVTVNVHPPTMPTPRPGDDEGLHPRLQKLIEDVGEERVSGEITGDSLAKWGWAAAAYRILADEVPDALRRRASATSWLQLFHYRYRDNAYMLTWGGVVVDEADANDWLARFATVQQCRTGEEALLIAVPAVTAKEAIHMNAQLPESTGSLEAKGIPAEDLEAYEQLYRWYPPVPAPI
jgi:hypothetical protein